jgi:hypothetical protein
MTRLIVSAEGSQPLIVDLPSVDAGDFHAGSPVQARLRDDVRQVTVIAVDAGISGLER